MPTNPKKHGPELDKWKIVYDHIYKKNDSFTTPFFNIECWKSSYTGEAYPAEHMQEWRQTTAARIKSLNPISVLEIGCGTGIILSELLPICKKYHATDLSEEAINYIRRHAESLGESYAKLSLTAKSADDFEGVESGAYDTAILNSVCMYFPDLDYFRQVIDGAMQSLQIGGNIFIGDIRHGGLLEHLHLSVILSQREDDTSVTDLHEKMRERMALDEELCLEPSFFLSLPEIFPRITQVDVFPRRGRCANEMTHYRYDVILRLDQKHSKIYPLSNRSSVKQWCPESYSLAQIRQLLKEEPCKELSLVRIPNRRIAQVVEALNKGVACQSESLNVEGLKEQAGTGSEWGIDPEELWRLEDEFPFEVRIDWSQGYPDGAFDAIFLRRSKKAIGAKKSQELMRQIKLWNNTTKKYPKNKCVHELFTREAKRRPDAVALIYENQALTYRELDRCTDQLANYLQQQGVHSGKRVGLFMTRSLEMLIGLLGVLKAGGSYVPFDPHYPEERILYMLKDAQLQLVVTHKASKRSLPRGAWKYVVLNEGGREILDRDENLVPLSSRDQAYSVSTITNSMAYMIYTSGSTGKPKGVPIPHRALTNFICSMADSPGSTEEVRLLALTTICFDIAGLELYMPLITGGCVEVLSDAVVGDGVRLKEKIEVSNTTMIQATPSTWEMLLAAKWEGKKRLTILCGGEALSNALAEKLLKHGGEVWNLYGPTETTIWSTLSRIEPGEKVTIGRPIANTQCYILDEKLQPTPMGEIGELHIAGDGLAMGYWGRPEETSEKFIPNPFKKDTRLYKTGDLAHYLADGRIMHGGRNDFQIKLHGYRIDLEEIESTVKDRLDGVDQVAVASRKDHMDQQIVAFLIQRSSVHPSRGECVAALKPWLPDYMIPSSFYFLSSFPLTLNKKIDRKSLSLLPLSTLKEQYGVKQNAPKERVGIKPGHKDLLMKITRELKALAATIINASPSRLESSSHLGEYGYNSIRFVSLALALNERFNLKIDPPLFFRYSSVESIAGYLLETFPEELNNYYPPEPLDQSEPLEQEEHAERSVQRSLFLEPECPPSGEKRLSTPIAIVGMGGIVPQAVDLDQFWDGLISGRSFIEELPKTHPEYDLYGKVFGDQKVWGGFIKEVDEFDASFFNISPREAEQMDPRQRLLLQLVWQTLEHAGHIPGDFSAGSMGVYIGMVGYSDYGELARYYNQNIEGHTLSGVSASIIANRISYFFDFKGPSITTDTACSSSLVGLLQAVSAIRSGQCEAALAGGINLMLSPFYHRAIQEIGILSEDGCCRTFDKAANGCVRGEGGGLLLLRPLDKALADHDTIYGIIKGSAENHGGTTNSLTAPSSEAQANLLEEAYRESMIPPSKVGYIEVHGTGTRLGDPAEINGLKEAFRKLHNQYDEPLSETVSCGLGAVKTNIGHLEPAAGVMGVMKVLLAMRHKQLPPTINFIEQNPYIEIENTPFYLVTRAQDWQSPKDDEGGMLARCAGVSSFGFGGANAHIVLEEYVEEPKDRKGQEAQNKGPYLIVLSAKNADRLKEVAKNLQIFLTSKLEARTLNLHEVAYTLQVGREAMEERVGLIVGSIDELAEKLKRFLEDQDDVEDLYRGQVKRNKEAMAVFMADEELGEAIDKWIQREKFSKLLALWVKGVLIDWNKLYRENKPQRIPLPAYPFAKQKYWISKALARLDPSNHKMNPTLHPLLHENTSTLEQQRFSSNFTGEEFFLNDHKVQGKRVLPAAAYLEMVREAIQQACEGSEEQEHAIQLKNVVWLRPIDVGAEPQRVHLRLLPQEEGEVGYEIYTIDKKSGEEPILHSQGIATLTSAAEVSPVNISALQKKLHHHRLNSVECYEAFKRLGLDYGPAHQGLQEVCVSDREVLAKLSLPSSVLETEDRFILHPSTMDSALQASIVLLIESRRGGTEPHNLMLPFSLESLEIIDGCSESMWVWMRYTKGQTSSTLQKLDLDICGEDGRVCVTIKGLSTRALKGGLDSGAKMTASLEDALEIPVGLITTSPVWNSISLGETTVFNEKESQITLIGGSLQQRESVKRLYPQTNILELDAEATIEDITKQLDEQGVIDHLIWIAPPWPFTSLGSQTIIDGQKHGVLQVFGLIKALLALDYATRDLKCTFITEQTQAIGDADRVDPVHAAIHGLVGSLAKEYPHWKIRLLDFQAGREWPFEEMFNVPYDAQGNALAYRDGEWFFQELLPVRELHEQGEMFQQSGVYVVIGGAGGLGESWSKWMLETYQARIIWIGRRAKDSAIQEKLDALSKIGPTPTYLQADATNIASLKKAYGDIKQIHTQIHGVIHSTIVLSDSSLSNMDEDRFKVALKAKIDVSVCLAQVFEKEQLDFVLFFSSLISFSKAAGQSNYAAGCTFKDAFAHSLSKEMSCAVKVMNWGYWGSVGVVTNTFYKDRMALMGIGSIEPEEGMKALRKLLNGPFDRLGLFKTLNEEGLGELGPVNSGEWMNSYPQTIRSTSLGGTEHVLLNQAEKWEQSLSSKDLENPEMEELLYKFLLSHVQGFLKSEKGFEDRYNRWMKESFSFLAAKNYVKKQDDERYELVGPAPDLEALWSQWEKQKVLWCQDPSKKAKVVLLEACLRVLPEILTGQKQPTDVIFPNSSMELVEGIYKGNVISDLFNDIVGSALVSYIQERLAQDGSSQIKILEIGAGTGGTTAGLLVKLRPFEKSIQEYCYTDLSKAFLIHAQEQYAPQAPYLTTHIFNVEKPLSGQDIKPDSFDVVIATNVLHATKNIRQTLRNAKAALYKGGILLVNEMSRKLLFPHLTFGLLEGWWLYEDARLRIPGSPGIYPETWRSVLKEEGFISTFFPAEKIHPLGQQIIVSQSDGIVRQKQAVNVARTPAQKSREVEIAKEPLINKEPEKSISSGEAGSESLREKSATYLKRLVAETLKMKSHQIDSSQPLEAYGIDSILVVQLTNAMRKAFDNISSTLFFEVQTIDALVEHLIKTQKEALIREIGFEEQKPLSEEKTIVKDASLSSSSVLSKPKVRRFRRLTPALGFEQEKSPSPTFQVEDIAIIGLSGRYPEAENVNEFWDNLKTSKNCIREIPQERWDWKQYFDEEKGKAGKIYTKWGGFLKEVDKFDPLFFQISPRDAEQMDPQERLFLEEAYKSIEDSGYTPETLCKSRKIGVFVGVMNGTYAPQTRFFSMANRISYHLNFQGPSMAVDTACSASLTAIHLALESLYSGMSECAIAGGVNLILRPIHYMGLSAMTMLSSTNENRSFGDHADGFVDGEGVGAVVLKSLKAAIADDDHIYGILKGSVVNAGGKTNGYTVPNPNAQYELVLEALKRSGIDARAVSCIEAHGTGTVLGDPIEVSGLARAFEHYSKDRQFCTIGSVKSNIGHCESAAGIAGVTKVLLQMQQGQIVPSLHSKRLNPNIDFSNTPFVVQQELENWNRPVLKVDGQKKEYPRIAGISSFGAGGANAHVVIEEYLDESKVEGPKSQSKEGPYLIVLSAKNEERLKEVAKNLQTYLTSTPEPRTLNLHEVAYTLQVGREAMEERLGLVVGSVEKLGEKLKGFLEDQDDVEDLYRGQVKRNKETLAVFTADEEFQETINKWIQRGKYSKVLDLWVKGLVFDWNKLYGVDKPQRISLPTYPFARERYWIERTEVRDQKSEVYQGEGMVSKRLHRLVHENTSTFEEQRFSSTFTGEEFFLADHVVKGQKMLPGVAYLEMARAAVEEASGFTEEGQTSIQLKNVVWARPIIIGAQSQEVHIGLFPEENGEIAYEIYTASPMDEKSAIHNPESAIHSIVHSQGVALFASAVQRPKLDLKALQATCTQNVLSADDCYAVFKRMGIDYGPGHQGIEEVYVGEGQVLAKLSLPSSVSDTQDQFILHPSLMDASLQAAVGLMPDINNPRPVLPFALEEFEVSRPCASSMWVWIRYAQERSAAKFQKLDLDLCGEDGEVCVKIRGLSTRTLQGEVSEQSETTGILMLQPVWREKAVDPKQNSPEYADHQVFLCGLPEMNGSRSHRASERSFIALKSDQKRLGKRFEEYGLELFERIQNIAESKPKGPILLQVLVPAEGFEQTFSGVSGLLKTAHLENPKLMGQVIAVGQEETAKAIVAKLEENVRSPEDEQIRYIGKKRLVHTFEEMRIARVDKENPWKEKGVYLITGGVGGLGLIFAREIAEQTNEATLILTGRSSLSDPKKAKLNELRSLGVNVEYHIVDVSDQQGVERLIEKVRNDFKGIHGIIHSAGVIRDNFILKKTREEFEETLKPKVEGVIHLDEATKDLPLDFFVLFSSGAGTIGNVGQADYATANAFIDAFAHYRDSLEESQERCGQILSINWPLWKEGGMGVDEATEQMMREKMGMVAMQTSTGIEAFYQGLSSEASQVLVMEGEVKKLYAFMNKESMGVAYVEEGLERERELVSEENIGEEALEEKVLAYFKRQLSKLLKLPAQRIQAEESFEKYGIDSILVMQLTNELEKTFGSLSKTLFFEYQNIQELSRYFLGSYRSELVKLLNIDQTKQTSSKTEVAPQNGLMSKESLIKPRRSRFGSVLKKPLLPLGEGPLDIAIVGLSGRYPQAPDLAAYWQNLRNGKDCITEVPPDRWDWKKYYTEDRNQGGRHYSKWGGFIEDVDKFDPLFFNISPREAELIDPQERLFLEHVWMALEDAGYRGEDLQGEAGEYLGGQVGVYAGVMYGEYQLFAAEESVRGNPLSVGGSYASIANRISYVLNLHGPSMSIDTMCSSSLTALHLACQDLKLGRTNLGVAGGVNVTIHPNKYLMLSNGQFISSGGHCESFGKGGDGYIPGEGVGVALLKRLSDAQRDGDHIYGVIKGSGLNHGGKTHGYSVPNPKAQQTVISRALKESGIRPGAISYIEAHGTGTKLGDPIEITGLSKAFGSEVQRGSCFIGSAKSNIGHCESAAGIAGVTKVLLQMKYGQIVPSLHSQVLNPNIDFSQTPFVVQQELKEWFRPLLKLNGTRKEYPRIAGVSSFGAGGANAHLVIEEYLDNKSETRNSKSENNEHLIILSAKNEDRLKVYAQKLLTYLTSSLDSHSPTLHEVAYTLQVGREAMEERLGLIVESVDELIEKLKGFLENEDDVEDLYRGQVKRNKEALAVFAADEDMAKTIDAWISKGKYSKLLDLWVKGLIFDWSKLYGKNKPQRISLPTYPFLKERYWINGNADYGLRIVETGKELHPLMHENTSTLEEQRFSSMFTGEEFFFKDHQVKGEKILPGVAYLEMAREAVEQATGERSEDKKNHQRIELKNVVWARPITVGDQPQEVHIGLFPEENGEIAYEIYTTHPGDNKSAVRNRQSAISSVVHSQGVALFVSADQRQKLDLKALQETCNQKVSSTEECYAAFEMMGIEYSPSYQSIEQLYIGENEVLAKLALPSSVSETKDQFTLNPILLDSALQASIGLAFADLEQGTLNPEPLLPFSLERLEIIEGCAGLMWACIRHAEGRASLDKRRKLDIDLCDQQGKVCVKIRGLSLRVREEDVNSKIIFRSPLQLANRTPYDFSASAGKPQEIALTSLISDQSLFNNKLSFFPKEELTLSLPTDSLLSSIESTEASPVFPEVEISKEALQKELVSSLAKALYIKPGSIDMDKPFIDMGLDSIVGVEWINGLNKQYGLSIAATKVYDYSSLVEFSRFFEQELKFKKKVPMAPRKESKRAIPTTLQMPQESLVVSEEATEASPV
nr:TPA_exp: polyketide synthase [Kiritimatiellota bacterium]